MDVSNETPRVGSLPGWVRPLNRFAEWADRRRWWMLGFCVVLYAAAYAPHWRPQPDSGDYLLVARSIAGGHGFVHPTGWHLDAAPGFPWLIAAVMRVFGTEAFWAINAVMMVIALANLALVYWLFGLHGRRSDALMATVLFAITETYFVRCLIPWADLPFMTGMLLLLVGLERLYKQRPAAALSVLLAVSGVLVMGLMRNVVITALGAVALGVGWDLLRARRYGVAIALTAAGLAGLVTVRLLDPAVEGLGLNRDELLVIRRLTTELPATLHRAVTENAYALFCERYSRAMIGIDLGAWPNLPIGVAVFAAGVGLVRRRTPWGLLVAGFTFQWLVFIVAPRYFLPILPLLCYGCWTVARRLDDRFPRRWQSWPGFFFMLFWVGGSLTRDVAIVAEQHHPDFLQVYENGRFAGIDVIASAVREQTPEDAILIADDPFTSTLMLWTNRPAHHLMRDAVRDADAVFAVTPLSSGLAASLEALGWRTGPVLVEAARPGDLPPLVLRAVERPVSPGRPLKN